MLRFGSFQPDQQGGLRAGLVQQPCLCATAQNIHIAVCVMFDEGWESTVVALRTSPWKGILGLTIMFRLTVQVALPPSFLLHLLPFTVGAACAS